MALIKHHILQFIFFSCHPLAHGPTAQPLLPVSSFFFLPPPILLFLALFPNSILFLHVTLSPIPHITSLLPLLCSVLSLLCSIPTYTPSVPQCVYSVQIKTTGPTSQ
jgi:hypothetical protein